MKFKSFAKYLDNLERTSSRIEITKILAELFGKVDSSEIDKTIYLSLGYLAPSYKGVVFNLADRLMVQAVAQAFNKEPKEVLEVYKQKGDLGNVAEDLSRTSGKDISVTEVYSLLEKIAKDEGEGSVERKVAGIASLLSKLDPLSRRFVTRIPIGRLRLGFSDKTVLDALSWMKRGDKSVKDDLEKAYRVLPDVGLIAQKVKKVGVKKTAESASIEIGVPILPMLTQRLKSPKEMIEKMGEVSVEPKLDGLRIQIHFKKGQPVKTFTRNLNETSWMFPELENISNHVKGGTLILDTEAIGVDENTAKLANFQTTMTRRRKHDIEKKTSSVPIKFYVFDILLSGTKNLMGKTYKERREELKKVVKQGKLFTIVENTYTKDPATIAKLNKEEKQKGLEGIMIKRADSKYVPGRTGWRWVKMKEAELEAAKLADTIDAVVMGYTRGKGKRAGFGIGQFLAGVVDGESVKTITKVGTGLTDEQFKELNKRLSKIRTEKKPKGYKVDKNLEPDYWVEPKQIVEIAADEITKSPNHTVGLALRFPRLIKFRDDKSLKETTDLKEIKRLFKLQ